MSSTNEITNNSVPYSFLVKYKETNRTFFISTEEKEEKEKTHKPIKLGDGTFGIVFEANDEQGSKYAVKVLYEIGDSEDSKRRYEAEVQADRLFYERGQENNENIVGIIKTYGYTEDFKRTDAGIFLRELGFEISNYALVMEKFDCTLKDLLEKRLSKFTLKFNGNTTNKIPSSILQQLLEPKATKKLKQEQIDDLFKDENPEKLKKLKESLKESIYELRGYDILEKMNFKDRMEEILPFLEDVASGLKYLHECQLLHFDLKPANIFVKKLTDGKLKTVIGDLGYLSQSTRSECDDLKDNNLSVIDPERPRGTRHYRSPEQKDYFDIADVEVKVTDKCVKLIIDDRKFQDSIVEKGDIIYFSKQPNNRYIISDIKAVDNSFEIKLLTGNNSLEPDKNTQVIFLKKIGYRTDIFGFGAIFFDLITCGNSPEDFYSKIKHYDSSGNTISTIRQAYESLYNNQSDEPGLEQIFAAFKQHSTSKTYAEPQIVELILKCISYKAQETFFLVNRKENNYMEEFDHRIMKNVWNEIQKLKNSYTFRRDTVSSLNDRNRLFIGEIENKKVQSSTPFETRVEEITSYSKEQMPLRLMEGIWFLSKFVGLIYKQVKGENFGLTELQPRNLVLDASDNSEQQISIKFQTYDDIEYYKHDLKMDFVHTKMITDLKNPFVPDFLAFMRREIQIDIENIEYFSCNSIDANDEIIGNDSNSKSSENKYLKLKCKYLFSDSSPYRDDININDWLVYKPQASEDNQIFFIDDIDLENQVLFLHSEALFSTTTESDTIFEPNKSYHNFIYYKNINPSYYYLHMIALYIYQLFFKNIDKNTNDKPIIANILLEYSKDINPLKYIDIKEPNKLNQKLINQIKSVINDLAFLYLKLTFEQNKDSYLAQSNTKQSKSKDIITSVVQEIERIEIKICKFLTEYIKSRGINIEVTPVQIRRLDSDILEILQSHPIKNTKTFKFSDLDLNFSKLITTNCLLIPFKPWLN